MSLVQLESVSHGQGLVDVGYENINNVTVGGLCDAPGTSDEGPSQGDYSSLDQATRNIQQDSSIYKSLVFHQYQNEWKDAWTRGGGLYRALV